MDRKRLLLFVFSRSALHLGLRVCHGSLRVLIRVLFGKEQEEAALAQRVLRKLSAVLAACRICLPNIVGRYGIFVLPGGEKILCPLDDAFIIDEVWRRKVYEKFFKIERDSVVVDAGAHVGIFAVRASKKVGGRGLVIACEPDPANYALLKTNLRNNRCENALTLNVALSDFQGEGTLYLESISCKHSLAKRTARSIRVRVGTLDCILREIGVEHVDLIKIDVEGSELEVLRGAEGILQKGRPSLSIAAYHTPIEAEKISQFLMSKAREVLAVDSYIYAS